MRDSFLFCFLVAVFFLVAIKQERLYCREQELGAERAQIIYNLVRVNKEIDFTIKRFEQLKRINKRLEDYCIKYSYRGWVSYDSRFYFPCQMLNPKNKIRSFDLVRLESDMDTAGSSSY